VSDYAPRFAEGLRQLAIWFGEGKRKYEETIEDGLKMRRAPLLNANKAGTSANNVGESRPDESSAPALISNSSKPTVIELVRFPWSNHARITSESGK